jgi:hypothetical protein
MKFVAFALFALVATGIAEPVSFYSNNVEEIVTVKINADADLSNQIVQTIVNDFLGIMNQQASGASGQDSLAETLEVHPKMSPEMSEEIKILMN